MSTISTSKALTAARIAMMPTAQSGFGVVPLLRRDDPWLTLVRSVADTSWAAMSQTAAGLRVVSAKLDASVQNSTFSRLVDARFPVGDRGCWDVKVVEFGKPVDAIHVQGLSLQRGAPPMDVVAASADRHDTVEKLAEALPQSRLRLIPMGPHFDESGKVAVDRRTQRYLYVVFEPMPDTVIRPGQASRGDAYRLDERIVDSSPALVEPPYRWSDYISPFFSDLYDAGILTPEMVRYVNSDARWHELPGWYELQPDGSVASPVVQERTAGDVHRPESSRF